MKKIVIVLISFCGAFAINSWAVEEVVVTGYYTGYSSSDYKNDRYTEWRTSQEAMMTRYGTNWNAQGMAAHQQAQRCGQEKGIIEKSHQDCLQSFAADNVREVGRCSALSNNEVSGQFTVYYLSGAYTIQNPTYDKCINMVNSLTNRETQRCTSVKVSNEDIARTANNGVCERFYQ